MSKYKKEIEKFCQRKLSHLKKPTTRKRKLVKVMALAIMSTHKLGGVPNK